MIMIIKTKQGEERIYSEIKNITFYLGKIIIHQKDLPGYVGDIFTTLKLNNDDEILVGQEEK